LSGLHKRRLSLGIATLLPAVVLEHAVKLSFIEGSTPSVPLL